MAGGKIRVLIVDDSALVRQILTEILNKDPEIEVIGSATDPYVARDKIKKLNPDVLTLDVEMPRMDGLTFLSNLMRLRPMPVVMVSSLTEQGAAVTFQALELGAVDFVTKPRVDLAHRLDDYAVEICEKVRIAARARVQAQDRRPSPAPTAKPIAPAGEKYSADVILQREDPRRHFKTTESLVAIGASTGGTEAIKEVLIRMPLNCPGIVITQHIPEAFSGPFARRMDSIAAIAVCEAQDGQQVLPGQTVGLTVARCAPFGQQPTVIHDSVADETQHGKLAVGKFMQAVRISHLERHLDLCNAQVHIRLQTIHLHGAPLLHPLGQELIGSLPWREPLCQQCKALIHTLFSIRYCEQ